MTLLGVQTAEECMLKHIAQLGILSSMAEESVVSSSFSVIYMKKILPSTRRLLDPIKTNHWPGKIPRKMKTKSTQKGYLWEFCRIDTKEV